MLSAEERPVTQWYFRRSLASSDACGHSMVTSPPGFTYAADALRARAFSAVVEAKHHHSFQCRSRACRFNLYINFIGASRPISDHS